MLAVSIESIHSQHLQECLALRQLVREELGGAVTLLVATRDPLHKRIDRCGDTNAWLRDCADDGDELALFDVGNGTRRAPSQSDDPLSQLDAERALRLARHQLEDICGQSIDGCASANETRHEELLPLLREAGFVWMAANHHLDCLHSERRLPMGSYGCQTGSRRNWLDAPESPSGERRRLRLGPGCPQELARRALRALKHEGASSQILSTLLSDPCRPPGTQRSDEIDSTTLAPRS